jgi:hypothetical protein
LDDLIKNKTITLEKDIIYIPSLNKELKIQTWTYYYSENADLYFEEVDTRLRVYLEIKDNEYIFYRITNIWYEGQKRIIMWKI